MNRPSRSRLNATFVPFLLPRALDLHTRALGESLAEFILMRETENSAFLTNYETPIVASITWGE